MDWSRATCPSCESPMEIQAAVCQDCGVRLEATFELSPLAQLSEADQVFVVEFLKSHGSIKRMEAILGVSYPTVKSRLTSIVKSLSGDGPDSVGVSVEIDIDRLLNKVADKEISVDAVLQQLRK